jgi:hypothetical protein
MGARVNFVFKQEEGEPNIVLYSHWGETFWRENLAAAIRKAEPRLKMNDVSYSTRIIMSQLIGEDWDSETGFGIYLAPTNMDYFDTVVEIDVAKQIMWDNGHEHSFTAFCDYVEEVVEFHNV